MTSKVAILGGSSSLGLGVAGRSYAVRVGERFGAELLQLSRSARTVAEVEPETVAAIRRFAPDLIIVSFGAAEAHVHPHRALQAVLDRFAPASWRGPAGMEPRAYYSRSRLKRLRQKAVSTAKIKIKRLIVALTGGFHRLPSEVFAARLRELLDELGPAPKVLVGLWPVDDYMFPRTNSVLSRNDELLAHIGRDRADVTFVPTAGKLNQWSDFLDDHAHLNDRGHDAVARLILAALPATLARRADVG